MGGLRWKSAWRRGGKCAGAGGHFRSANFLGSWEEWDKNSVDEKSRAGGCGDGCPRRWPFREAGRWASSKATGVLTVYARSKIMRILSNGDTRFTWAPRGREARPARKLGSVRAEREGEQIEENPSKARRRVRLAWMNE